MVQIPQRLRNVLIAAGVFVFLCLLVSGSDESRTSRFIQPLMSSLESGKDKAAQQPASDQPLYDSPSTIMPDDPVDEAVRKAMEQAMLQHDSIQVPGVTDLQSQSESGMALPQDFSEAPHDANGRAVAQPGNAPSVQTEQSSEEPIFGHQAFGPGLGPAPSFPDAAEIHDPFGALPASHLPVTALNEPATTT
ncbi:hypothetical protein PYCC9005_004399 [Savitreella phatthalungensis]